MRFLNYMLLFGVVVLFGACPRPDIKPEERKESLVTTTLTGASTITGSTTTAGTSTSLGVSTTLGTHTLSGNSTAPADTSAPVEVVEIPVNDTVYFGRKKPFFYADFDTAFQQNEIKIIPLRSFLQLPPNQHISCPGSGIGITSDSAYQKYCISYVRTLIGANISTIAKKLPAINFTNNSLLMREFHRSEFINGQKYFKTRLIKNQNMYVLQNLLLECDHTWYFVSDEIQFYITLQPLSNFYTIGQVHVVRSQCKGTLPDGKPYSTDTVYYRARGSYPIK